MRIDGACGGYAHHNGAVGVLLQVEGGNAELAKDICMHMAMATPAEASIRLVAKERRSIRTRSRCAKEREILCRAARPAAERKARPEKIIDKMVEGRLRNFYAERCLLEQPFVKDDKRKTVGQVAKEAGMKIIRFVHWEIPKE